MQRPCEQCGRPFEASRSTARFCSSTCRANRSRGQPRQTKAQVGRVPPRHEAMEAVRAELVAVRRETSPLGVASLILAARIDDSDAEAPAALAALVRELRVTLAEALAGAAHGADTVDEVAARRQAKIRAIGGQVTDL